MEKFIPNAKELEQLLQQYGRYEQIPPKELETLGIKTVNRVQQETNKPEKLGTPPAQEVEEPEIPDKIIIW